MDPAHDVGSLDLYLVEPRAGQRPECLTTPVWDLCHGPNDCSGPPGVVWDLLEQERGWRDLLSHPARRGMGCDLRGHPRPADRLRAGCGCPSHVHEHLDSLERKLRGACPGGFWGRGLPEADSARWIGRVSGPAAHPTTPTSSFSPDT